MTTTTENPVIQKTITDLLAQGITFEPDSERVPVWGYNGRLLGARFLENVVFTKDERSIKIANRIFFRESGLSTIYATSKDSSNKDNTVKTVTVTDVMFYQMMKESVIITLNRK
jgi:hypothetical protein